MTSQKPGGGSFQSLNVRIGTSRPMALSKASAAALATACRTLGLDQRSVDRRSADAQDERALDLVEFKPVLSFQRWRQRLAGC